MKITLILATMSLANGAGWYLGKPKDGAAEKKVELKSKASGLLVRFKKLPSEPVKEGELLAEPDKKVERRRVAEQDLGRVDRGFLRVLVRRRELHRPVPRAQGLAAQPGRGAAI